MKFRPELSNRLVRQQADLQSDSKTLRYEFENLVGMAQRCSIPTVRSDPIASNAYCEAFAVHCRSLIFFLYGHLDAIEADGNEEAFSRVRENDVIAYDFHRTWDEDCPPPSEIMVRSKWQADKHVAHITSERREVNQPGSSKESIWTPSEAVSAICTVMARFLERATVQNFDTNALRRMNQLIGEWSKLTGPNVRAELSSAQSVTPSPASRLQAKTEARTLSGQSSFTMQGRTE